MRGEAPRRLYRIVSSATPAEADFRSAERQGRRLRQPVTPELLRSFRSVSAWDTFERAEAAARDYPKLGRYVAVLQLPPHIRAVRFGAPGHWDIEAEPIDLLRAVVAVLPIGTVDER